MAARVVCGSQLVAATISSRVAPSLRCISATMRAVLLSGFSTASGRGFELAGWAGEEFTMPGDAWASGFGVRANRRARFGFVVSVMGGLLFGPRHNAAPTTRSPAGHTGRGGSRSQPAAFARAPMRASNAKSSGKNQPVGKLDMDFEAGSERHVSMDDENDELINLLCTRIGSIMEDASVIALTLGKLEPEVRLTWIAELKRASASIAALVAAVELMT